MYSIIFIISICCSLAVIRPVSEDDKKNTLKTAGYIFLSFVTGCFIMFTDALFAEYDNTPNFLFWTLLLIILDLQLYGVFFKKRRIAYPIYTIICILSMVFLFYNISAGNICTEAAGIRNLAEGHLSKGSIQLITLLLIMIPTGMELLQKLVPLTSKILHYLCFAAVPFMAFYSCELAYNEKIASVGIRWVIINVVICALIELWLCILPINKKIVFNIIIVFAFILGLADYFLICFRGCPFVSIDIRSMSTAATIAGGYSYVISDTVAKSLLFTVFSLAFVNSIRYRPDRKETTSKKVVIRIAAFAAVLAVFTGIVLLSDLNSALGVDVDMYYPSNTYEDKGMAVSFIALYQMTKITEPEGYDEAAASELIEEHKGSAKGEENGIRPSVIVIMNESFADLSYLGKLDKAREHLEFMDSLSDDEGTLQKGRLFVSTRGGNTAKSEFEFLTGDTMAFMKGIIPYTVYHFDDIFTFVRDFDDDGYETIAMHPDTPNNWARNRVYPEMGFEECFFRDSFDGYEMIRDFISDRGDYERVIDEFEKHDEPVFIFNITEQNHGGYTTAQFDEDDGVDIVEVDEEYRDYDSLFAYQSLVKKTDEANRYLIEYLRKSDRPVIVCFFGDHQPALGEEIDKAIISNNTDGKDVGEKEKEQREYTVPYFIWANFDVKDAPERITVNGEDVSGINYLTPMIRTYAGLDNSGYGEYLLDLRNDIPVINSEGYLGSDMKWHTFEETTEYTDRINEYRNVQYYEMFGKKSSER